MLFAAADWESKSPSFHPIGLAFVSLSVCADAILPNAQERLFRLGSSRLEVTFFTNIFTLMAMTFTTMLSGDFFGLIAFSKTSHIACIYMVIYTFIAYIAISIHMTVVRRFGGVAAVLVATGRKGMTLVISFIIFPKGFSWFYVVGAILVLGGLLLSSLVKLQQKKRTAMVEPLLDPKHNDLHLETVNNHLQDLEDGIDHKKGESFFKFHLCRAPSSGISTINHQYSPASTISRKFRHFSIQFFSCSKTCSSVMSQILQFVPSYFQPTTNWSGGNLPCGRTLFSTETSSKFCLPVPT